MFLLLLNNMRKIITSKNAPAATGPFSHGVLHDHKYTLEVGGQVGLDPKTGKLVEGGIAAQTEQTLKNIKAVLSEVGWTFKNLTKLRVFLVDFKDYGAMNWVYAKYLSEDSPARAAVAVKGLPLGALIEIECVASGDKV
jgi:2-iminobutanoate/2-iminopropanoate deaminase